MSMRPDPSKEERLKKMRDAIIEMEEIIELANDVIPEDKLSQFLEKYYDETHLRLKDEYAKIQFIITGPNDSREVDTRLQAEYSQMMDAFNEAIEAIKLAKKSKSERLAHDIAQLQRIIDREQWLSSSVARQLFSRYYDETTGELKAFKKYNSLDPQQGEVKRYTELEQKLAETKAILIARGVISVHPSDVNLLNKTTRLHVPNIKKAVKSIEIKARDLIHPSVFRKEKTQVRKLAESANEFEQNIVDALRKPDYTKKSAEKLRKKYQKIEKKHRHLSAKGVFDNLKKLLPGQNSKKYKKLTENVNGFVSRYSDVVFSNKEDLFAKHPLIVRFDELKQKNVALLNQASLLNLELSSATGTSLIMSEMNYNYNSMVALLGEMSLEMGQSRNNQFVTFLGKYRNEQMTSVTDQIADANEKYAGWLNDQLGSIINRIQAYLNDTSHDHVYDVTLESYQRELSSIIEDNKDSQFIKFKEMPKVIDYERQLSVLENLLVRQKEVASTAQTLIANIDESSKQLMQSRAAVQEESVTDIKQGELAVQSRLRNQMEVQVEIQKKLNRKVVLPDDLRNQLAQHKAKFKSIIGSLSNAAKQSHDVASYRQKITPIIDKIKELYETYINFFNLDGDPSGKMAELLGHLNVIEASLPSALPDKLNTVIQEIESLVDSELANAVAMLTGARVAMMKKLARPVTVEATEAATPKAAKAQSYDYVEKAHDALTDVRGKLEEAKGKRDGLTEIMVAANEKSVSDYQQWVPKIAEHAEVIKVLLDYLKNDRENSPDNKELELIESRLLEIAQLSLTDPAIENTIGALLNDYVAETVNSIDMFPDDSPEQYVAFAKLQHRLARLPSAGIINTAFYNNGDYRILANLYGEKIQLEDRRQSICAEMKKIAELDTEARLAKLNRWQQFQVRNQTSATSVSDKKRLESEYQKELRDHISIIDRNRSSLDKFKRDADFFLKSLSSPSGVDADDLVLAENFLADHKEFEKVVLDAFVEIIDARTKDIVSDIRTMKSIESKLTMLENTLAETGVASLQRRHQLEEVYVEHATQAIDNFLQHEITIIDGTSRPELRSLFHHTLLVTSPAYFWDDSHFNADYIKHILSDEASFAQFLHHLVSIPSQFWVGGKVDAEAVLKQYESGSLTLASLGALVKIDDYKAELKTQSGLTEDKNVRHVLSLIEALDFIDKLKSKSFFPIHDKPADQARLKAFIESIPEKHWRGRINSAAVIKACMSEHADYNAVNGYIDLDQYGADLKSVISGKLEEVRSECSQSYGIYKDLELPSTLNAINDELSQNENVKQYAEVSQLLHEVKQHLSSLNRDKKILEICPSVAALKEIGEHHEAAQALVSKLSTKLNDLSVQRPQPRQERKIASTFGGALQKLSFLHKPPSQEAAAKLKKHGVPLVEGQNRPQKK